MQFFNIVQLTISYQKSLSVHCIQSLLKERHNYLKIILIIASGYGKLLFIVISLSYLYLIFYIILVGK